MPLLIDTDVAIHLRDGSVDVSSRLAALGVRPSLSIISHVELEGGIAARPNIAAYLRRANDALLAGVTILDFDGDCALACSAILQTTGYSRSRAIDRMIAATALAHDLPLVTINGDDFRDIPGLSLEIWPAPAAQ